MIHRTWMNSTPHPETHESMNAGDVYRPQYTAEEQAAGP